MGGSFKCRDSVDLIVSDSYDKEAALDQLLSTKAGVKGLVDSGIVEVPEIFKLPTTPQLLHHHHHHHHHHELISTNVNYDEEVPIINLEGYQGERRKDVMNEVLEASRTWGIFQVVNHGIPLDVHQNMLESVRNFHEQPNEMKEEFYSHDSSRKVWYYTTVHPVHRYALWKDTIACQFDNLKLDLQALPPICRKPMSEYVRYVVKLKEGMSKLLSEGLGLESNYLEELECMEARKLVGHYYPACPEPEATMGTPNHTDPYFFTILSQNDINGLQVFHHNHWIDIRPVQGAVIAIIGDMLQLISNDLLKSAEHRVLASKKGPRLSAACFFFPNTRNKDKMYGPISDLISDSNPALYRETTHVEYLQCFHVNGNCALKTLPCLRK